MTETLCPYEVEYHCDEIVDYDTLTTTVESPIWDDSSCDSPSSSSAEASDPMDVVDRLTEEQRLCDQREQELRASLAQVQAQRNRMRDEQVFYLTMIPRDECLTRYGLLWSTSTYCPRCSNPLRACTQCTYHSHSSSSTGHVYWFPGQAHPDHCLVCRLDTTTHWTSLKVARPSES